MPLQSVFLPVATRTAVPDAALEKYYVSQLLLSLRGLGDARLLMTQLSQRHVGLGLP